MNFIMVIFFIIIGIAGLIYKVDAGVFIGFSLFPYQFSKMKISNFYNNILITIGALIGSVYFIWTGSWLLLVLFLFSQALTFSASQHLMKNKDKTKNRKKDLL